MMASRKAVAALVVCTLGSVELIALVGLGLVSEGYAGMAAARAGVADQRGELEPGAYPRICLPTAPP